MGQWQDQVREHQVWQLLQTIGTQIDQAVSREGIDATSVDYLERLRSVNAYVGKRLASVDPILVPPQALDAIVSQLQAVSAGLQNFVSDGQVSHLISANSNASEILILSMRLPSPSAPDDLTVLSEAAAGYRNSMTQILTKASQSVAQVQQEAVVLSSKLADLVQEVANQRSAVTTLTSDFQAQFSAAQENRAKEFSDQQGARQKEFGEAQTMRQARFDDLHSSFTQRLNDQSSDLTRQSDALLQEAKERLNKLDSEYQDNARKVLDVIQQHRADVEKLVGVIGNLGVTSGYQKVADSAKKAMWLWQGLTLFGFVVVIGFALFAFLPALQNDFSWERFAGRVVLTVAV